MAADLTVLIRAGDELTDLLGSARSLEEAAPGILRILMATREWDGGFVLLHDSEAEVLRPVHAHWRDGLRISPREEPALHEPVPLAGTRAGLALRSLQPLWCPDLGAVSAQARCRALAGAGVHGCLALPVVYGGIPYGLIELISRTARAEDPTYAIWAMQVGKQVGQFLERSEAVRAAVRSRRTLDDLFTNAPVGIVVLDAEGRVQRANHCALRKLALGREQCLGRPWRELHADPASADEILARLDQGGADEVVVPEVVLRAGDGSLRWVQVSANARWEEGRVIQRRVFLRDLTPVRRAEASARESQERYRRLVEGARDFALHALDVDGRVTAWNSGAQRLYGWSEGEILGRDFADSFTPEDRSDDVPGRLLRLAADEGRFRHEGWRVRRDGTRFRAEVLYTALRDAAGGLVEISQLTRDVTERERLEALRRRSVELEACNRDVLSGTRDGAAVVRRIAEALERPLDDLAAVAQASQAVPAAWVQARVHGLRDVLRQLEDAGARGGPEGAGEAGSADVRVLAQEAVDLLSVAANERRVRVEVAVDASLPPLDVEPARLRLLMYNLLAHAIRSSRERGLVHLVVQPEGESHVRLQVEDSGVGHTEAELARLFGGDEGEVPGADDAGRLLLAVRRVAEQHGGRAGAHSIPGSGTAVFVVLPSAEARARARGRGGFAAQGRRVLVVSMDAWTRAKLCWTLGNAGYDVVSSAEPDEALGLAREARCEVIAVDLRLGGMGPVELVAALRAEGASRAAPCVLAALGVRSIGVAGLLVTDLLPRPAPADRLFAALERADVAHGARGPVVVVDADPAVRRAAERSLALLGYRAAVEQDGHAALRTIAQERPTAILLSPFLKGIDPYSFLHHLRRLPAAQGVPVLLAVPRSLTEPQLDELQAGAAQAAAEGLWHQGLILQAAARECPQADGADAPVEPPRSPPPG